MKSIYARNCNIRRISRDQASDFLANYHLMGTCKFRYAYGLFTKNQNEDIAQDTLVAVATFSSARKWQKGDKVIKSYEWIRYACLSEWRIDGGMGKVLSHFIKDVDADDIMSYVDPQWSDGKAYKSLGFIMEGEKLFANGKSSLKFRLKVKEY